LQKYTLDFIVFPPDNFESIMLRALRRE